VALLKLAPRGYRRSNALPSGLFETFSLSHRQKLKKRHFFASTLRLVRWIRTQRNRSVQLPACLTVTFATSKKPCSSSPTLHANRNTNAIPNTRRLQIHFNEKCTGSSRIFLEKDQGDLRRKADTTVRSHRALQKNSRGQEKISKNERILR